MTMLLFVPVGFNWMLLAHGNFLGPEGFGAQLSHNPMQCLSLRPSKVACLLSVAHEGIYMSTRPGCVFCLWQQGPGGFQNSSRQGQ